MQHFVFVFFTDGITIQGNTKFEFKETIQKRILCFKHTLMTND